jgi:uroporphyrin-III C-methyltransferase
MALIDPQQLACPVSWPLVQLVGAGPGDPDLLTLKALKAIKAASVLLVDDLVSKDIVQLASKSCRVIYVGKRGGCRSTPQAFIEKLMVQSALAGERVVRLKGGDPFIFGRGGEEVESLKAQGIRVQVINGITSGLAALSSLDVSLTQRDHAHGVIFITGHAQKGHAPTDWVGLAQCAHTSKLTLVIYMGMTHLEEIQAYLLKGLPDQTPAAIIESASSPLQRQLLTDLGQLSQEAKTHQLKSPSIVVVGNVLLGLQSWLEKNTSPLVTLDEPPWAPELARSRAQFG